MAQGKRHSRRVVRLRLLASRGAERPRVARRRLSRRPRPISRLVPQLAADRHRHPQQSALQRRRHARLDARRKGPADVEVARQHFVSRRDLRTLGRRFAPPLGRQRRISSRREDERARDDAAQRRVSQNPQHVPLRPRQSCRLRSVAPRAAQRSARRDGSLDARAYRRPRQKMPRLVFRITNSIASITRFTISASSISARFITTC